MVETVTDIIVARSKAQDALSKTVVWSVVAHAVVLGVFVFVPYRSGDEAPREVMTISLGGSPGPQNGGLTQAGGRAVQAPQPIEQPKPRVEAPPAPTRPEMTLPDPKARVRPKPEVKPTQAPAQSTGRTASTGERPTEGSTRTDTQVRGQGFGLSTSGNNGLGGPTLDVANFCCPEYLQQMIQLIQRNWNQNQGMVGVTTMRFTVQRDGSIVQPLVERPSGFPQLDLAAQRALVYTRLTPLPPAYPNPDLTVHLQFQYQR